MTQRASVVTKAQPSLSEWFRKIEHKDAEALQEEDVRKRDRLEILRQIIGIDYDRVTPFPATDFFARTPEVVDFITAHGDELCSVRLTPLHPSLPKLRTRGRTLNDSLAWLDEQDVDLEQYEVGVVEHSDTARWSTIFVVREDGIFGQVVEGLHHQLTQGGTLENNRTYEFLRTPDGAWQWGDGHDADVQAHMEEILEHIRVTDPQIQARLKDELDSEFTSEGFLIGYLETLLWPTKLIFIDYNRKLHTILQPPSNIGGVPHTPHKSGSIVKGIPASAGEARGVVRLVAEENLAAVEFNDGDILVTDNTDVRYLPLMRRAGAIVTDRGGMLSHAAITARELGVPCIVGCRDATRKLKDGQTVSVDATKGVLL